MTSMRLLATGEALIASCAAGWFFYILAWLLERPFLWNAVEQGVSKYRKLDGKEMQALLSGLHVRAVGTVHNTIQVLLCLYVLREPVLWEDAWHAVTPLTQGILIFSAGFFLWDIAVSVRRASHDGFEFVLHGTLCFAFYIYTVLSGNFHFYGCGFLLWELSTPFVQFRWLLYKLGQKESKLYLYNGILMIIVFGLCRICWGGYLGVKYVLSSMKPQEVISPATIWVLRGICVTLNGLNWYWYSLMVTAALRVIMKKPLHSEGGASARNGVKQD